MYLKEFVRSFVVYLIITFVIIAFFALWRTNILEYSNIYEGTRYERLEHISVRKTLLIAIYIATLMSFLSAAIDVFILKSLIGKRSLGQVILFTAIAQLIIILFVIINASRFIIQIVFNANPRIRNSILDVPDIIYIICLLLFSVAFARGIIEMDRKLGKGNLWLFLIGRFYKPHEDERIFMFLDLKASTTIAEKIGHYKFSQLIQDCFLDLSVVEKFDAEVYQYVGDEVVLTWKINKGLKKQRYLQAFFAFKEKLKSKEKYYQKKYGVIPEFKAGANAGMCMVTEVGELKREICYHGDTLNTAARIEALCNEYDADFMISEFLFQKTEKIKSYNFEEAGNLELRGKVNKVKVYKVW